MEQVLTDEERNRLIELVDIMNTATQVDREEAVEAETLWERLCNAD